MVSDGGEGGQDVAQWALRFISGKYQGGEFPLRPNREIIIGRSSDLDMVLVEDMVSRKHAKITTDENVVSIQDLGSTNGTFVNGEKVRKAELKDGDRILIGTSIIKIVFVDGEQTSHLTETEARSKMAVAANRRSAAAPKSMAGSIEEIPLPDLLQLLSTSKKSGVLVVHSDRHVGKTFFLARARSTSPASTNQFNIGPRKALTRMLGWTQGSFELEPPDEARGAGRDGGLDRGAADRRHAPARRVSRARREAARAVGSDRPSPRPLKGKLRDLVARRAGRVPGGARGQDGRGRLRPVAAHRSDRSPRSWSPCSKRATSSPASSAPFPARLLRIASLRSLCSSAGGRERADIRSSCAARLGIVGRNDEPPASA